MPNRILRDGITASDTIDVLTSEEEVFFYRLLTVCDDYGLMDARPKILLARCFPLKTYTEKQVARWLQALCAAPLIGIYEIAGRPYLTVLQWDQHQRVRNARPKYPQPPVGHEKVAHGPAAIGGESPQPAATSDSSENQLAASRGEVRPPCAPAESNPNPYPNPDNNTVGQSPTPPPSARNLKTEAQEVLQFLNAKAGRGYPAGDVNLDLIASRLKEGATAMQCRQVIAKKVREWAGDEKMAEYLRPKTLFNRTNFAQYVGELVP